MWLLLYNINLGIKMRPSWRQVALIMVWLSLSIRSPNPTPPAEMTETMASRLGLGSGNNWHRGKVSLSPSWLPRRQSWAQTGTSQVSHSQVEGSVWRLAFVKHHGFPSPRDKTIRPNLAQYVFSGVPRPLNGTFDYFHLTNFLQFSADMSRLSIRIQNLSHLTTFIWQNFYNLLSSNWLEHLELSKFQNFVKWK